MRLENLINTMKNIVRENGDTRLQLNDLIVDITFLMDNERKRCENNYVWVVRNNEEGGSGTHIQIDCRDVKEFINSLVGGYGKGIIKCAYRILCIGGAYDIKLIDPKTYMD